MRRVVFLLFLALLTFNVNGQTNLNQKVPAQIQQIQPFPVTYRLFPTQNIKVFIKLNTRNGEMWLVQYGFENKDRFETYLNIIPLVSKTQEIDNRFTLYPTENFWTFILLDQIDGNTWQVQWSFDVEEFAVVPIKLNIGR
jgi:hypothetical protein